MVVVTTHHTTIDNRQHEINHSFLTHVSIEFLPRHDSEPIRSHQENFFSLSRSSLLDFHDKMLSISFFILSLERSTLSSSDVASIQGTEFVDNEIYVCT